MSERGFNYIIKELGRGMDGDKAYKLALREVEEVSDENLIAAAEYYDRLVKDGLADSK